ncbi:MAG: hypothetical protein CENE_00530 [Candidatus Celerinatantimonas neptuna]|nr:MAG: hypothetical protein CENE_00530 [Candidatus Celerinatantimonas neptuna]
MNNTINQQHSQNPPSLIYTAPQAADDEIDLRELFIIIWQGKWLILFTAIIFGTIGGVYAFLQPNIYQSNVLLAPASVDSSSRLTSMASQLGGLASLAGINVGSGGDTEKVDYALQVLESRRFIGDFITNHRLLVPLMATRGWDRKSRKLIYKKNIYNINNKKWLVSDGKNITPTLLQSIHYFKKHILNQNIDKKNNTVNLTVDFYSPIIARKWAKWLVDDLNNEIRQQDMLDAQNSINYLNQQIKKTSLADTRSMLYQLIEQQTKTLMLTKVRKEYVFKTIDPAVIAENPIKPKRKLIVIVASILGIFIAIFWVFIRKLIQKR